MVRANFLWARPTLPLFETCLVMGKVGIASSRTRGGQERPISPGIPPRFEDGNRVRPRPSRWLCTMRRSDARWRVLHPLIEGGGWISYLTAAAWATLECLRGLLGDVVPGHILALNTGTGRLQETRMHEAESITSGACSRSALSTRLR